ncbi:glutamate--tRNA ligase [archaeon]|nr:glutamate--tRNA ligase [archaeon]
MKDKILPFVLKNMLEHDGSANPKAVLGLVLRSNPDLKKQVPQVLETINTIIKDYQDKSKADLKKELIKIAPELAKEKPKEVIKGPLKELPNAKKGKVVVRIAPSPSGPMHVGHAYGALLNSTYAKMYDGKFILRIEDTNPANIYEPAYQMIEDDANWLTHGKVDRVVIQSDRIEIYNKYIKQLTGQGDAYVCDCDPDIWREMKSKKAACPCRDLSKADQLIRLNKMYQPTNEGGYAEGEVVLRMKTNINHKNPAMRDFSLARIAEHSHPKTKSDNRVWPLMVLSVAIDDHELGITHVLNGKDHYDNGVKESLIMKQLGWEAPVYRHWGRINFEGMKLSTSKTRIAIEQGEYTGWDDIKLATLKALRRRGYQVDAFAKFAVEIGLSMNDKTVSQEEFWKNINSFNKEIVEPIANRYFFVEDPVEIIIEGLTNTKVKLNLHPDDTKRGQRELKVNDKVLITKKDQAELEEGKVHRLIDACNFIKEASGFSFHSFDYLEFKDSKHKGKILHFLPNDAKQLIGAEVMLLDGNKVNGKVEKSITKQKVGDIVQLERQYFARIDSIEKGKVVLWYLHK